jgi:hypothetical protein
MYTKRPVPASRPAPAPADVAKEVAKIRGQWTASKKLEKLSNEEGVLSGARAATAAKGMPGELGDVAKIGARMKGLPMSGTAERLMYQSMLSGGMGGAAGLVSGDPTEAAKWAAGSFAAPWMATQLLTRAPIKQYLTHGLANLTPAMEKKLIRSGGLLGLSSLNAISGN